MRTFRMKYQPIPPEVNKEKVAYMKMLQAFRSQFSKFDNKTEDFTDKTWGSLIFSINHMI